MIVGSERTDLLTSLRRYAWVVNRQMRPRARRQVISPRTEAKASVKYGLMFLQEAWSSRVAGLFNFG